MQSVGGRDEVETGAIYVLYSYISSLHLLLTAATSSYLELGTKPH
jgi:hypothetical protein